MKKCFFLLSVILFFSACDSNELVLQQIDNTRVDVVKLAMPNHGAYTYEETVKHKDDIYDMQLSVKYREWKASCGSTSAIHINRNDEIELYKFPMSLYPPDTSIIVESYEMKDYDIGFTAYGCAGAVLITSEYDLRKSKSFKKVMEEMYRASIQIYYLVEK